MMHGFIGGYERFMMRLQGVRSLGHLRKFAVLCLAGFTAQGFGVVGF